MPALICGSFSDHNLHSRGSFRGFERISSTDKHLYTHRTGKWAAFYSDRALAVQLGFLDRHLRPAGIAPDTDAAAGAPVRLEVRESRDVIADVRAETAERRRHGRAVLPVRAGVSVPVRPGGQRSAGGTGSMRPPGGQGVGEPPVTDNVEPVV